MPIAAGSAEWQGATEWHVTNVLNAHAGPQAVYDALSGKVRWTDPAFVDSITLLQSWFDKGWMGGDKQRYFTNKFGDLYTKLAAEKAAMCVTGAWSFTEVPPYFGKAAGNDAKWAWAPLPSLGDHVRPAVFPLGIGSNLSIRKGAPNPKAAATFLDFLLTDKALQTKGLAEVNFSPAPVRLSESDFPPSVDERLRSFYTQLSSSDNIGYTSWTFWPPKSDTYLYIEMEKVITGKVTPKAFCEGLDTLFQQELKAGKVPPRPRPGPGA
jgi:raffinose/stachyose/melibiose transport system substrate-binding protein